MDAETINLTTDIVGLVGDLKRSGRYHIGPCPFCGGVDRFNVKAADSGKLWICRQCGDGKYQDAVSFLMQRDNLTFSELLAANGAAPARPRPDRAQTAPSAATTAVPGRDWQSAAMTAVNLSADYLSGNGPGAAAARSYLAQERGLSPATIERARVGYNPSWREFEGAGWLAPGITIPAVADGQLWYVQVRTTKAARLAAKKRGRPLEKYHAMTGSRLKALYQADSLLTSQTAVVAEGEFDALLLGQYLPEGWAAVTMGAAGTLPDNPTWLRYFAAVKRAFLVMDNDQAGETAVSKWRGLLGWVEPLPVPDGHNDITDYWRAGGRLAAWATSRPAAFRLAEIEKIIRELPAADPAWQAAAAEYDGVYQRAMGGSG